jgi:putative Mg2+ transporter-C (MgtC) family protein
MQTPLEDIAIRLLVATALGIALGWERESRNKPAGLRTHALVALGSASFIVITLEMVAGPLRYADDVMPDPTRIIQGIIGGIGFLGAGSIIQSRGAIKGLTTGASIWAVGAVGIAAGIGLYLLAAMVAAIMFVVLSVFGLIEHRWKEEAANGSE